MATAKNRAIDELRRRQMLERNHERVEQHVSDDARGLPEIEAAIDEDVGDDLLRLVLVACHPALSAEARVALTREQASKYAVENHP